MVVADEEETAHALPHESTTAWKDGIFGVQVEVGSRVAVARQGWAGGALQEVGTVTLQNCHASSAPPAWVASPRLAWRRLALDSIKQRGAGPGRVVGSCRILLWYCTMVAVEVDEELKRDCSAFYYVLRAGCVQAACIIEGLESVLLISQSQACLFWSHCHKGLGLVHR